MRRRSNSLAHDRDKLASDEIGSADLAFLTGWLSRRIGNTELCRAIVVYAAHSSITAGNDPETAAGAIDDFIARAEDIARLHAADFARVEMQGLLCGWIGADEHVLSQALAAARALASAGTRRHSASCAISHGTLLVSDYAASLSSRQTRLTGYCLAVVGHAQASAPPCGIVATADVGRLANACGYEIACLTPMPANRFGHLQLPLALDQPVHVVRAFRDLGHVRRFLSVASIIGTTFDQATLDALLCCERGASRPVVAMLTASDVVRETPTTPVGSSLAFVDPVMHDVAYHALPTTVRTALHADLADLLSERERSASHAAANACAARIATHYTRAGRVRAASEWWRSAAMDAIARDTPNKAIEYLTTAHDGLQSIAVPTSDTSWTEVCRLLGTQLATVKGNASPAVLTAYGHGARRTAGSSRPAPPRSFDTIWGLLGCYLTRGEMDKALRASRKLVALAEISHRPHLRMLANRMAGLTELLQGNLASAVFHLRATVTEFDVDAHAELRFQFGSDQLALAHAHLAWAYSIARDRNAQGRHARQALQRATAIQHAHTSAHVCGVLALAFCTLGAGREAALMDLVAKSIAGHHEFPYWRAWARIVRAAMLISSDPLTAHADLGAAINCYHSTGARQLLPWAFARSAEACLAGDMPGVAEAQACTGLDLVARNAPPVYKSELCFQLARCRLAIGDQQGAAQLFEQSQVLSRRMRANFTVSSIENETRVPRRRCGSSPRAR